MSFVSEEAKDFCKGCIYYPCPDCDEDTETIHCDFKVESESETRSKEE